MLLIAIVVLTGCSGKTEGSPLVEERPAPPPTHLDESTVIGSERSATPYEEAVTIEPNDPGAETCTGVIVAPRVVLYMYGGAVHSRSCTLLSRTHQDIPYASRSRFVEFVLLHMHMLHLALELRIHTMHGHARGA